MADATFQLMLSVFPTVLFFISLIPRSIVHYPQRQSSVRDTMKGIDSNFLFNLTVDSFALSVINGLILMFQYGQTSIGFTFMFISIALCVFGFSALYVHSNTGSAFIIFVLAVLFMTEFVFFVPALYLLWVLPTAVLALIVVVALVASRFAAKSKPRGPHPTRSKSLFHSSEHHKITDNWNLVIATEISAHQTSSSDGCCPVRIFLVPHQELRETSRPVSPL